MKTREVLPELLDDLPPQHPEAKAARIDLRRINRWMGNARLVASLLSAHNRQKPICKVIELGAGDGTWILQLAKISQLWKTPIDLLLLDRNCEPSPETLRVFREWGWTVAIVQTDALTWLRGGTHPPADLMVANLFLHHFPTAELTTLLDEVAKCTNLFLACEPRRSPLALLATFFLGFIGCRRVTRYDAFVSVKAGFRAQEISRAWPSSGTWATAESRAGLFSHCFVAARQTV